MIAAIEKSVLRVNLLGAFAFVLGGAGGAPGLGCAPKIISDPLGIFERKPQVFTTFFNGDIKGNRGLCHGKGKRHI